MPDLPDLATLPDAVATSLQLALIGIAALIAFLALRTAVSVSIRHLIERRTAEASAEAGGSTTHPVELERRMKTIGRLAVRVAGGIIAVIAGLMALGLFGIDIGPAIAGLGVVGIAVGFGAQTLVRDWLAGIFVILENQYSTGDVVRIAGVDGVVEELSLRRTTLRDLDGTVHTVPNGQITVASNLTRLWARVNLDVGVAYDTDIDRATAVINETGEALYTDPDWSGRLLEAPRVIRINALDDSAVTLKVLGQVAAAEQWAVAGELRKRILAAFGEAGIEIPFPHRVIVNRPAGTPGEPAADDAAAVVADD